MKSLILALAIAVPLFSQITSYPASQIVSGQMQVNQPNGVPQLDANGHVASAQQVSQLSSRTSTGINYVFEGDSLTAGFGNPAGSNYPAFLVGLSSVSGRATAGSPFNFAVSGNKCSDVIARYTASVHPVSPAATGTPGEFAVWCGTNDINASIGLSTIESNLTTEWSNARTDGFKVVAFTVMLYGGGPGADSVGSKELERQQLNQWIRSQYGSWDYLIDVDQLFLNPSDQTFFQTDNIHLNVAGDQLLARYINQALWGDGVVSTLNYARTPVQSQTGIGNTRGDMWNLFNLTTGGSNAADGWYAGNALTTGSDNTFFGYNACLVATLASSSVCIGSQAGKALIGTSGSNDTLIGYQSGLAEASGADNTLIGYRAANQQNGSSQNTIVGSKAGQAATTNGGRNYFGYQTGNANTGCCNSAFGDGALKSAGPSNATVAVGQNSLTLLTSGNGNTAVGYQSGSVATSASQNTWLGSGSGQTCTTCTNTVAIGFNAKVGAAQNGAAQIGTGTNSLDNSIQFQAIIVTRVAGTFSTLPACASGIEGSTAPVTDSTTATYAATITGSGTNHVRAYCNGTNWVVD